MKEFTTSERLKELMAERDLRQVDILKLAEPFCKKFGLKLGKNEISQYVSGKVEPRQDKLSLLGMALNVSEVWLMGYDVPMIRNMPATETGDGLNTGLSDNDKIIIELLMSLSDSKKVEAIRYLRYLAEQSDS